MTSTAVPPAVRSPLEKAQHALAEFAVVAGGQLSEGQPAEETVLLPREPDASARTLCRPWHKRDLYQRLRSYRSSTWFGKPEAVSELQCSSRGWRNVDVDVLTCEVCQARVTFPPVAAQPGNSPAGVLAQVKQAASSFAAQLNTAHDSACPWRGNRCERDLVSFPALSAPAMLRVWQGNLHSLSGLSCLPNLDSTDAQKLINANRQQLSTLLAAIPEQLAAGHSLQLALGPQSPSSDPRSPAMLPQLQDGSAALSEDQLAAALCSSVADRFTLSFLQRAKVLAICGWQVCPISGPPPGEASSEQPAGGAVLAAQDHCLHCTLCGATEGLWLFVPASAFAAPSGAASKRRMLHQASRNIAGGFRGALGEPQSSSANGLPGSSHAPAAQAASSASAPRPFGGRTASRSLFGAPPAKAAVTPGTSSQPVFGLRARRTGSSAAQEPAAARAEAPAVPESRPGPSAAPGPKTSSDESRKRKPWLSLSPKEPQPFQLLQSHRPFCPWHRCSSGRQSRCGWQWGLDVLVPSEQSSVHSQYTSQSQDQANPAARLRRLLNQIGTV